MKTENNNRIINLSDAEFLTFLYSERDRENSLNQVPGWSRWAVLGAWITVLCASYVLLKENKLLDGKCVLYLTSAFLAFFLSCISFFRIITYSREVDYSKVKLLKEVIPRVFLGFVFLCSTTLAILVLITDSANTVFWLWVALLVVYCLAYVLAIIHRDDIVPAYYFDTLLPWKRAIIFFEGFVSILYVQLFIQSFKKGSDLFFSPEFEFSVFISALLALSYLYFSIRVKDNVVNRIDSIIEGFLYMGVSKEESYNRISINRWGYSVLDACQKELSLIQTKLGELEEEEKTLERIKGLVQEDSVAIGTLKEFQTRIDSIVEHQDEAIALSKKLAQKLNQILKVAPALKNVNELDYAVRTNQVFVDRITAIERKVKAMGTEIYKKEKEQLTELITTIKRISDSSSCENEE